MVSHCRTETSLVPEATKAFVRESMVNGFLYFIDAFMKFFFCKMKTRGRNRLPTTSHINPRRDLKKETVV